MRDGALIVAIMEEIEQQLWDYGIDPLDLRTAKGAQNSQQYVEAANNAKKYTVLVTMVTQSRISDSRQDKTNSTTGDLEANYMYNKGRDYQIECLTNYDPSDANSIQASELCSIIADLLRQSDSIENLKNKGVYVSKIGDVRPSFSYLDQGQFESTPSFDLSVTYNNQYTKALDTFSSVTGTTEGVN